MMPTINSKTPLMRLMSYAKRLDLRMEKLHWHQILPLYSVNPCGSLASNLSASKRARTRLKNLAECSNRFSLFKCHDVFDGDYIQSPRFIENISEFGFVLPKSWIARIIVLY